MPSGTLKNNVWVSFLFNKCQAAGRGNKTEIIKIENERMIHFQMEELVVLSILFVK
jgi:hypothetical protein